MIKSSDPLIGLANREMGVSITAIGQFLTISQPSVSQWIAKPESICTAAELEDKRGVIPAEV